MGILCQENKKYIIKKLAFELVKSRKMHRAYTYKNGECEEPLGFVVPIKAHVQNYKLWNS